MNTTNLRRLNNTRIIRIANRQHQIKPSHTQRHIRRQLRTPTRLFNKLTRRIPNRHTRNRNTNNRLTNARPTNIIQVKYRHTTLIRRHLRRHLRFLHRSQTNSTTNRQSRQQDNDTLHRSIRRTRPTRNILRKTNQLDHNHNALLNLIRPNQLRRKLRTNRFSARNLSTLTRHHIITQTNTHNRVNRRRTSPTQHRLNHRRLFSQNPNQRHTTPLTLIHRPRPQHRHNRTISGNTTNNSRNNNSNLRLIGAQNKGTRNSITMQNRLANITRRPITFINRFTRQRTIITNRQRPTTRHFSLRFKTRGTTPPGQRRRINRFKQRLIFNLKQSHLNLRQQRPTKNTRRPLANFSST